MAFSVNKVQMRNSTMVDFKDFTPSNWLEGNSDPNTYIVLRGERYTKDYVIQNCAEIVYVDRYSYVLSQNLYITVCVLHLIWLLGMYGLWDDACRKRQLYRAGRRLGIYRGIVDIATGMSNNLGSHTSAYSDAELQKSISKQASIKGPSYHQSDGQSLQLASISSKSACGRAGLNLSLEDEYVILGWAKNLRDKILRQCKLRNNIRRGRW